MNSGQWLDDLLDELGWTPADLSRESGLASAVISNIRNGKRNAGPKVLDQIADAAKLPHEEVYRRAGLLKPAPLKNAIIERILHEMADMTPEEKEEIHEYVKLRRRMNRRKSSK